MYGEDSTDDNAWHYKIEYNQFQNEEPIPDSTRVVLAKPTEVMHMLEIIKFSLPALCGWHVMHNPAVTNIDASES